MNKKNIPFLLLVLAIFFLLLALVIDFTIKQNQDEIQIIQKSRSQDPKNQDLKDQDPKSQKNEGIEEKFQIPSSKFQTDVVLGESDSDLSKLSVNTSTEEELDTIPGVGSVTAKKIIDGRPWEDLEECLKLISARWRGEARGKIRL